MRLLFVLCAIAVAASSPASAPDWAAANAGDLVRPIVTTIRYADGELQRNTGAGFVIGNHFYTAFHNIQTAPLKTAARDIIIGDRRVEPLAIDIEHDLAAFEIPPDLCRSWCNNLSLDSGPGDVRAVTWIRLDGERQTVKQGRVRNVAFKSTIEDGASGDCEDNLVVEIDTPFVPGSSGGPVFDSTSGAIVGLIQGSFETPNGRATGYYKPLECVAIRLARPDSLASASLR